MISVVTKATNVHRVNQAKQQSRIRNIRISTHHQLKGPLQQICHLRQKEVADDTTHGDQNGDVQTDNSNAAQNEVIWIQQAQLLRYKGYITHDNIQNSSKQGHSQPRIASSISHRSCWNRHWSKSQTVACYPQHAIQSIQIIPTWSTSNVLNCDSLSSTNRIASLAER